MWGGPGQKGNNNAAMVLIFRKKIYDVGVHLVGCDKLVMVD